MTHARKAMTRKQTRRALDVALAALLLLQMGYQLLPEDLHATLGLAMTLAATAHLALNAGWVRALGRGRWNAARALMTVAAGASLLLMLSLALSGLVLSGLVDALRPLDEAARAAHLSSSYLALLVLPLHAGTHLTPVLDAAIGAKGARAPRPAAILGLGAWVALACLGAYEFVTLHVWDYVTLRMPFVLPAEVPLPLYLLEHFSVMALCALLGAVLARLTRRRGPAVCSP